MDVFIKLQCKCKVYFAKQVLEVIVQRKHESKCKKVFTTLYIYSYFGLCSGFLQYISYKHKPYMFFTETQQDLKEEKNQKDLKF